MVDNFVGIRSVPDNISEVHDLVARGCRGKACLESFQVAMNVA
jgi:hypothetical protein